MDELSTDLQRYVHDQRHISARALRMMGRHLAVKVEALALGIGLLLALCLTVGDNAQSQVLANLLLVGVPFVYAHAFPDEAPSLRLLIFHYEMFGFSTLLDSALEPIGGYYLIKILAFASLYLQPYRFADTIQAELEYFFFRTRLDVDVDSGIEAAAPSLTSYTPSSTSRRTAFGARSINSTETAQPPTSPKTAVSPIFSSENAMIYDSRHQLGTNSPTESDTSEAPQPGIPVNLHDLVFAPTNNITFNGPFDDHPIIYYMNIKSNSTRPIAFAIKSNAIPRITVIPPYGIITPKSKLMLAVTLHTFDYEKVNTDKDRIAIDYVFCTAETSRFSHRLFQGTEIRRRKNILVKYNP